MAHEVILRILSAPFVQGLEWSYQGLGMLQAHMDPQRIKCLHIWCPEFSVKDVTTIHDHPWDFTSEIISGAMMNVRYYDSPGGFEFDGCKIIYGPGSHAVGPLQRRRLIDRQKLYHTGMTYTQKWFELHKSEPTSGTVTLVTRTFVAENHDFARVYYPTGQTWVSAEPRPATNEEVEAFTQKALEKWNR